MIGEREYVLARTIVVVSYPYVPELLLYIASEKIISHYKVNVWLCRTESEFCY